MPYVYLAIAIVSEVIGTTALKASEGFSQTIPSLIVVVSYSASFYFLALVVQTLSISVAYAVWAGLGIVLVALAGVVVYRQIPDFPAILGMAFIVAGVCIIHLFSKTVAH